MATLTSYPDPSPEVTTVDGRADDSGNNTTWTNLIAEPGNAAVDNTASGDYTYWLTSATTNQFATLERGFMLFDTSSLSGASSVTAATLSMYGNAKSDPQSNSPTTNITSSAPASNTAIAAGDFDSVGSTAFATAITYAGFNTAGYNDYVFNASGVSSIATTGVSKYSIRMGNDIDDSAPTWASSQWTGYGGIWADTAGTSSDPKLVITYTGSATNVFYPNPSVEDVSVDGYAAQSYGAGAGVSWSTLVGDAGNLAADSAADDSVFVRADTGSGNWRQLFRFFTLFDTASIGDSNTISSATYSVKPSFVDPDTFSLSLNITACNPASNTAIVSGDYDSISNTDFATDIAWASFSAGTYEDFTVNATGIASISLTGITKYCLRFTHDIDNSSPTWSSAATQNLQISTADTAGVSSDPKLTVVHGDAAGAAAIIPISTLGLLGVG